MTTFMRSSLGAVLTELGPSSRLLTGPETARDMTVAGASIWAGRPPSTDPQMLLVIAGGEHKEQLEELLRMLPSEPVRMLVLTAPCPIPHRDLAQLAAPHLVLEAGGTIDPAEVVLAATRAVHVPAEAATRRLATLQRSLTQALGDSEPVASLMTRLRSTTNSHVAFVDKLGQATHSTGPVPSSLLFQEISRTDADSQMLDLDGWRGVADKVHNPDRPGDYIGWLIAISRRPDFPDQYSTAAVHVGASLVEACHRMTLVARQQERAIKAAVLEEALALRRLPDDPDLAGRIASFGLNFDAGVRVAILRPLRSSPGTRAPGAVDLIAEGLSQALRDHSIPHLVSRRERHIVVAVQCSAAMLSRAVVAADSLPHMHIGVGRSATSVGEISQSHGDARLAIRRLQKTAKGPRLLAYESFDFATRLFSEVGADQMTVWAQDFLRPLVERPTLLEGLSAYFKHEQNMNAAADALSIHHNSLRYRLAKVEEILELSLREPSALASLFLALTALEQEEGAPSRPVMRGRPNRPADVEAPRLMKDLSDPSVDQLGVVLSPDRR